MRHCSVHRIAQQRLHFFRHGLLGTVGGRYELRQAAEFQELTEVTNAAVGALHEDQVSRREQLVEKGHEDAESIPSQTGRNFVWLVKE